MQELVFLRRVVRQNVYVGRLLRVAVQDVKYVGVTVSDLRMWRRKQSIDVTQKDVELK